MYAKKIGFCSLSFTVLIAFSSFLVYRLTLSQRAKFTSSLICQDPPVRVSELPQEKENDTRAAHRGSADDHCSANGFVKSSSCCDASLV